MVKIDVDRMINGKRVGLGLRAGEEGGIPWYVLMTADNFLLRPKPTDDGTPPGNYAVLQRRKSAMLANANDPENGNVGFPATPAERGFFMKTLRQASTSITEEEFKQIAEILYTKARERIGDRVDG